MVREQKNARPEGRRFFYAGMGEISRAVVREAFSVTAVPAQS